MWTTRGPMAPSATTARATKTMPVSLFPWISIWRLTGRQMQRCPKVVVQGITPQSRIDNAKAMLTKSRSSSNCKASLCPHHHMGLMWMLLSMNIGRWRTW
jgi:hypothetical protein